MSGPDWSPEDLKDHIFQAMYALVDTNNDNILSREEFDVCLKRVGLNLTDSEVDDFIARYDTSGDGELERDEFYDFVSTSPACVSSDVVLTDAALAR